MSNIFGREKFIIVSIYTKIIKLNMNSFWVNVDK